MVVEMVKSYGNVMGDSMLETCVWIGHFERARYPHRSYRVPRKTAVTEICQNPRANDSNVRMALIDYFSAASKLGGGSKPTIGTKNDPGPLYGVKRDIWSAIGIAVAWHEITKREGGTHGHSAPSTWSM
jgi:hypothetical protein